MARQLEIEDSILWYQETSNSSCNRLQVDPNQGLTSDDAAIRLQQFGPNVLPSEPEASVWQIFFRQFTSPLIYILVFAAILALAVGDLKDAIFIAIVLLVNALIGSYQEWKAEKSSRALQKLIQIKSNVTRDGKHIELDSDALVPGDIVHLESGFRVPADLRLLSANGLELDESLLTGESLAVGKDADWMGTELTSQADQKNMAFAGSVVVRGRAHGVTVATGADTSVGQLAVAVVSATLTKTPLMERMERFSRAVALIILVSAVLIGAVGILIHNYGISEMMMYGVALAVAAIPEGLPITITIALAIATTRMARRQVIVRRLAAVEGLGSCTLIASDKTGTLTSNEITVKEVRLANGTIIELDGQGFKPQGELRVQNGNPDVFQTQDWQRLCQVALHCNEANLEQDQNGWTWRGDPTEIALLTMVSKAQLSLNPKEFVKLDEIPFEAENKYAAVFLQDGERVRIFAKGAPEKMLAMCEPNAGNSSDLPGLALDMATRGFRVLAMAHGELDQNQIQSVKTSGPSKLEFLGFVGMIDPLRAGVKEAVARCHKAGIRVCMVTGDHPVTALAISKELGLAERADQVVSGQDLHNISAEQWAKLVENTRVFARMAPTQKLELVENARKLGHYVAVTGDGVNDAPALRAANIGVAMGKGGTDVARESAELVLSDDNFASIVAGVEEGRVAYDNIRKVIFLLVSTGAAEVLLLGMAVATGTPLPLLPVQILWLNLVTSGIQDKPLVLEPAEGDPLRKKPRSPREPIFNRLMIERTVLVAVTMASIGYIAFTWMLEQGVSVEAARNKLLLLLVMMKTFHLGTARSETRYLFGISPLKSPVLLFCAALAVIVHLLAIWIPWTQSVLQLEAVSLEMFLKLTLLGSVILLVMDLHKFTWRLRYGEKSQ